MSGIEKHARKVRKKIFLHIETFPLASKDAVVITFKAVEGNSIEKTCQKASCGLVQ